MTQNATTPHHDPAKKRTSGGISGELICKYCNAVYQNKRWIPFEKLDPTFIDQLKKGVCPACHLQQNHLSDGVVHLTGKMVGLHKEEIKNLLHNIAQKEEARDVENRLERMEETDETITLYTSKKQLATEMGKHVDDAYKGGTLEIKWSKEDKPVEVRWHHDGK